MREEPVIQNPNTGKDSRADEARLPLCFLGMGVFYGWLWIGLFSPEAGFFGTAQDMLALQASWVTALVINLSLWIYLIIRRSQDEPFICRRWFVVTATTFAVLGRLLIALNLSDDIGIWVTQIGGIALISVATGLMPVLWAEVYGRLEAKHAILGTICSALISLLLCLTVTQISHLVAKLILLSALTIAGSAFLLRARTITQTHHITCDTEPPSPSSVPSPPSVALGLIPFALGLAYGLMLEMMHYFTGSLSATLNAVLAGAIGAIGMLAGMYIFSRKLNFFQFTYRAIVPLLAAGLILLPGRHILASAAIMGGTLAFDLIMFATISSVAPQFGMPSLRLAACARALSHGGILAGILLGRLVAGNGLLTDQQLIMTSLLTLWILVVALTYSPRGTPPATTPAHNVKKVIKTNRVTPDEIKNIHTVAADFGLSKREEEVLGLLMHGRNVPHIQDELGISLGTVKFHIRNIYKKFAVHSRQELLDQIGNYTATNTQEAQQTDSQNAQSPATCRPDAIFKL